MFLFLKRILLPFFVLNAFLVLSQKIKKSDFDSILKSELSFSKKKIFVDSIINLDSYSEEELSYLYHAYARLLFKKNKVDESISFLSKAVELRKKNQHKDLESLKKSLFNKGYYLRRSRDYFGAIATFRELSELPNEDRLCIKAYSELIYLYEKIGDFEKSIMFFKKSTAYYSKEKKYRNLYKNYMRISRVYASMDVKKNYSIIINYLSKVDSLRSFTTIDEKDEAIISLRYGNTYEEIGEKDKALFYYNKALIINKKLKDSNETARLYNNIGYLHIEDSSFVKASKSLKLGLDYVKDDLRLTAILYNTYATYYQQINDFQSSKYCYQKAMDLLVYGNSRNMYINPTIKELSISPNKLLLLDFITQKAAYWVLRYNTDKNVEYLRKALKDYELADQLVDVIRFESSENASKMFWRSKGASMYLKAVNVCYLLNDIDKAYLFIEKNKALLLLEHLSDEQAQLVSNLPNELVEMDYLLKNKILKAEEDYANGASQEDDEIFKFKQEYEQFKEKIAEDFPEYSRLRKELPVLTYSKHKEQFVDDSTATLQFVLDEGLGYALVTTNNKTFLYEIENSKLVLKNVSLLTEMLQSAFQVEDDLNKYSTTAYSILQSLLPSVVFQELKGKKLTVSANNLLQNIPFEALVTKNVKKGSDIPYFIKTNEINYVYSFSYLFSNNKKLREPKHTFLGFAPQKFKDTSLAILPNSIIEINNINAIFTDAVFLKENATKENFISNFNEYKIIHLATHSGLNDVDKPWLAFSDEKVSLNELYTTQNQADLVVLSACKTSQGELKTGEGIMSLARGFFFSGTNSVISTLWNINDKTTQELMYSFYTNLKKGKTKSNALHESKLTYLTAHKGAMASPFYWSSFVLIGDANVIAFENDFSWTLPVLLLVVVVLISIGIRFRRRFSK